MLFYGIIVNTKTKSEFNGGILEVSPRFSVNGNIKTNHKLCDDLKDKTKDFPTFRNAWMTRNHIHKTNNINYMIYFNIA